MRPHPLPDFQPSPALAALAVAGYAAAEIIQAAHDLEGLDRAFDAVRLYAKKRCAITPGQVRLLEHFQNQLKNAPPDIAFLCGLLAHQVQEVHLNLAKQPVALSA